MSSTKKIAKNTILLYIRMIINMAISLYTSRIILQKLGVEDFGIYNLVAGVVVLFSFLNNAMTSATQRFLNIELASNIKEKVNRVFCMSLNIHIIISIIVLILSETIGLWFLNYKLNIPAHRLNAANFVFQFSIITTIINIIRIPFNATILANERMSFYAYLGIVETVLKLAIVFLLSLFVEYDQLIVYSFLLLLVNLIINVIYKIYCYRNFKEETAYHYFSDKKLFRELLSFSGWSLFGQVAVLSSTQGLNMIMNIFIGVTVNAALGIANQVNSVLYSFVSNMQVAFNPQITQSYASNDLETHKRLVLNTSKYSVFLFLVLSIPILLHTEFILKLWLGVNLPQYLVSFTQIVIIGSIINAIVGPFWMSANAIGNIRNYQLGVSLILLLNLPLAYIFLKLGFSPVYIMSLNVILNLCTFIFRFLYVNHKLKYDWPDVVLYLKQTFLVIFSCFILVWVIKKIDFSSYFFAISSTIAAEIILLVLIILIGIKREEYLQFKKTIIKKIKK
ncbi:MULTISPECIES: oligosaccharide flippase family protein [Chryseobacterium]|nr:MULTISPECIES: oligosaccharide flippase family protein [Chryseobacterium]MDH5034491.1 oligosaccharide flippase family protein [Chryseobacterium cucumeris]RKE77098.1 Na+-driven multidrug efflux pump [Chryseobacterium sp. AG363]